MVLLCSKCRLYSSCILGLCVRVQNESRSLFQSFENLLVSDIFYAHVSDELDISTHSGLIIQLFSVLNAHLMLRLDVNVLICNNEGFNAR